MKIWMVALTSFDFLFFILSGVGLTNLIVNATIFDLIRNYFSEKSSFLNYLLTCMMCSGFWVGALISLFLGINPFMGGFTISLLSNIFDILKDFFIILTERNIVNAEAGENDV